MDAGKTNGESQALRDIMSIDLVSLEPGDSLRDAVDTLARFRIGAAPVLQAGEVVGVISGSDILAFQATLPDLPTGRPEAGREDDGEDGTWIEGEEPDLTYFLESPSDIAAATDTWLRAGKATDWHVLEEHTVDELMTRRVHALPPSATLEEAADLMARHRIHRVLVMEGSRLLGLVSGSDIVRSVGARPRPGSLNGLALQRFEARLPVPRPSPGALQKTDPAFLAFPGLETRPHVEPPLAAGDD